jgi:hypothetical protein
MNIHSLKAKSNRYEILSLMTGLLFFLGSFAPSYGQTESDNRDISQTQSKYFPDHNPTKAMWMSAALPGLGQYYNQKYWKIPIVYTGFATLAYFSIINRQEYVKYRDAYSTKLALSGAASDDPLINNYSDSQLLSLREYYQSNLELNYILFGAFYLLQVIDAAVDAHFYSFDINDNLSMKIDPVFYQNENRLKAVPAICLRWKIGKP